MHRTTRNRILLLLLALLVLSMSLFAVFALASHAAHCRSGHCVPCLNLAKLQGSLRHLGGLMLAAIGLLALLLLLRGTSEHLRYSVYTTDLV
ncbi:MAG: hypothetical protein FWD84_02265, partial [Oscillospiraceae bacterium]|nr:hypothetical protein [Oscillospiraceae bacterium]